MNRNELSRVTILVDAVMALTIIVHIGILSLEKSGNVPGMLTKYFESQGFERVDAKSVAGIISEKLIEMMD